MSSAIFVDPLAAHPERVESAKEKSLQERDEEAAAYYMTRVQAIHRGKMARQQMNQEQEAALRIQAALRGNHDRQRIGEMKTERADMTAAALRIQSAHRGKAARQASLDLIF